MLPAFYHQALAVVKGYANVTAADVIAVCLNESHGISTFLTSDPLYKLNMRAAFNYTGLQQSIMTSAITIGDGDNKSKLAKFRFEPSYWTEAKKAAPENPQLRFLLSCSLGLGQIMSRNLIQDLPTAEWEPFLKSFMASDPLQIKYVAGTMDKLLLAAHGNLFRAYCGYNSGNINSADSAVHARAQKVVTYKEQVEKELATVPTSV